MLNCLTIDLEPWMCYYDVCSLNKRLDNNQTVELTHQLLDIFERHDVESTFFVMGEVYDWYPELIEEIASSGHEIAFHTSTHIKIRDEKLLTRELKLCRNLFTKFNVVGFRAPQMTFPYNAIKILSKNGFKYDSSIYSSIGRPFKVEGILEVPVSTYPILKNESRQTFPRTLSDAVKNLEIPFGSGYSMGLLSTNLLNKFIMSFNRQNKSAVLFIHPWQLSKLPELQRKIGEHIIKFPYRIKISKEKLESILANHQFSTIKDLIKEYKV